MKTKQPNLATILITSVVSLVSASCTTTRQEQTYAPPRVIDRIASGSANPDWASGARPFYEEAGQMNYISTMLMSGDARPEACNNAAADLGRVQILRQLKDNLTASGQLTEANTVSDPGVESLIAFLAQGKLSGVRVTGRYWEKREESDSNSSRVLKLFCATKITITRSLLDEQLRAALGGSGNPEIRRKLLDAQKGFLDGIADQSIEHQQVITNKNGDN